jgi:hypothetical protein
MGARDEIRLRRSLTGVERLGSSSRQPDIGCRPLGFGEPPWGLIDHRWSKAIPRAAL